MRVAYPLVQAETSCGMMIVSTSNAVLRLTGTALSEARVEVMSVSNLGAIELDRDQIKPEFVVWTREWYI